MVRGEKGEDMEQFYVDQITLDAHIITPDVWGIINEGGKLVITPGAEYMPDENQYEPSFKVDLYDNEGHFVDHIY